MSLKNQRKTNIHNSVWNRITNCQIQVGLPLSEPDVFGKKEDGLLEKRGKKITIAFREGAKYRYVMECSYI